MKSIIICFFLLLIAYDAGSAQTAIIANGSVPVDSVDKMQLFDYYSMDIKFWDNGEPIILFDLKLDSEMRDIFYDFLGKSSSRMKSIWLKKMLLGEGDPPEALQSEQDMLDRIMKTRGSLGFISLEFVTDDVKILKIIQDED